MPILSRIRFSLAKIMMFVLACAAASALYARIMEHTTLAGAADWSIDIPTLFLLGIVLTALALGFWKSHTAVQIMLQVTLACLGCLTLIWIGEAKFERGIRYWFQACFAATVTLPLIARGIVKSSIPRGPRRNWWKKTCEAVFFSFLNMMLITAGGLFQTVLIFYGSELLGKP
jgi:hypothetical protein